MKKSLLLALSLAGLTISALAAEKEVTVEGQGQCAKCSLKKTEACQNAIVAKVDGKEVVYFLVQNDASKKFHGEVCKATKHVKAVGTVKEVDGKKEFTISKIELVK